MSELVSGGYNLCELKYPVRSGVQPIGQKVCLSRLCVRTAAVNREALVGTPYVS